MSQHDVLLYMYSLRDKWLGEMRLLNEKGRGMLLLCIWGLENELGMQHEKWEDCET